MGSGPEVDAARGRSDLLAGLSQEWLGATAEIARALLSGADEQAILAVVERALTAGDCDYACLAVPAGSRMAVVASNGLDADDFATGLFDAGSSAVTNAMLDVRGACTADVAAWTDPAEASRSGFGPAMVVPLAGLDHRGGALLLVRLQGKPPFTAPELELAAMFAAQVALALELGTVRARAERIRALEVRHRIAQELHDSVIQRLFAIGVGLQALVGSAVPPELAERLSRHIGDLDETIDEIRNRIFGLAEDRNDGVLGRTSDELGGPRMGAPSIAAGQHVVI